MPAELVLATWNINSVRLRRPIVERLLNEIEPDVLCLQETKCQDGQFPAADFRKIGYPYVALNGGRGGYHGVAIVSRLPLGDIKARDFCGKGGDPRHVSAVVEVGGTALVGISKPVIKAHGSSNAACIFAAVRQAMTFVNAGVIDDIKANIEYMKLKAEQ